MKRFAALFLLAALLPAGLFAQAPGGVRMADLEQDVLLLKTQIGQMRMAIEALQRENAALRQAVGDQAGAASQNYVTLQQLNNSIRALREELLAANSQNRAEIVAEVSRQMERLAQQTQKAIDSVAGAVRSTPSAPAPQFNFSDDFPKEGVPYTVQTGDTLSGIAKKFNSSVRDIQNANKIADPTRVMAGQTLFIPQRKE